MKSATVGIGILAAISAPTALAIALAQEANVTLIGFARPDGSFRLRHAQRVDPMRGVDQECRIDESRTPGRDGQ